MAALSNVSNPSNAQNVSKSVVVSEDVARRTVEALTTLHTLYQSAGNNTKLPDFAACSTTDLEVVCKRALTALVRLGESKKEQIKAQFKTKVEGVILDHMAKHLTLKAEYDSLSPSLKALMPTFSSDVVIPVTAFVAVFPKAYTSVAIAQKLIDFGYKGNGAARGPKAGLHTAIVVPFDAKALAVAPAPTAEPVVVASNVAEVSAAAEINDNGDIVITPPSAEQEVVEDLAALDTAPTVTHEQAVAYIENVEI